MLKKLGGENRCRHKGVSISNVNFPTPFAEGLNYNPPSRGKWNIVHMGMLIPQSHQIYFCAQGCLRGVVQTTAEMNAMDRLSWVYLCDEDYADGSMEQNIIDSVTEVIHLMGFEPPCIPMFLSCMHLFAGVDFEMIIDELKNRFPNVDFIDCYMTPTMRKSGLAPEPTMCRQMYKPLKKMPVDIKTVNIIGNDWAIADDCELMKMLRNAGYKINDITYCKTYDEYLSMARARADIVTNPVALSAGDDLEKRLGHKHLYLPLSYDYEEIIGGYRKLCEELGINLPDFSDDMRKAEEALQKARETVGDRQIAVDYLSTTRPLGLCRLLLEHGFNVTRLYADNLSLEEADTFELLKNNYPRLMIYPAEEVSMRFAAGECDGEDFLAVGQIAAYFCCTDNFVDVITSNGMYGFDGIVKLCELICDAAINKKDRKAIIEHKGLGCESCL